MRQSIRVWLPAIRAGSGADVFIDRLAAALRRRGVHAVVTWFPHWTEITPYFLRLGTAPKGINIIHANSAYAAAFRRNGIPLVITEHHYLLDPAYEPYKSLAQRVYHRGFIAPCLKRSYALADAIATDSRFTANVITRLLNVSVTKTISLWADYSVFSPGQESLHAPHSPFRLLYVGNASRRKGADVIPKLARRLGREFEIRCTAGLRSGRQVGVPDNVVLLGRLGEDQLIHEYRACDAVLVPSRYEGFGYSALEAMACGKPVVGFRCGAVEEVVAEGETALLCDIDDLDALEAHCRRLAEDQTALRAFGSAGRERATTVFTEAAAMDKYLDLYGSL